MNAHPHNTTTNTVYIDHARLRWPGYSVAGSGPVAVLWRCRHHVELCGSILEARQKIAARCGVVCRAGNGERRWHVAYDLAAPPPEKPRPSFPGWDEDD